MRRRRRKYTGPKRPVRWIYSGVGENENETTDCAIQHVQLACGNPVGVVDPPRTDLGEFWHEMVRGDLDLDFSDKAAPCITRIVGDLSVRAAWNFLFNPPGITGFIDLPPYVRLGICVVDEPSGIGWLPPDLWDPDDGDGVRWLWRKQLSFTDARGLKQKVIDTLPGSPVDTVPNRVSSLDENFHVDIRVNATVNKNQSLIMCHSYRFEVPLFFTALTPELEDLAQVTASVCSDLRCLVKS